MDLYFKFKFWFDFVPLMVIIFILLILILITMFNIRKTNRIKRYLISIGYTREYYSTPNLYKWKDKNGNWVEISERKLYSMRLNDIKKKYR